MNFVKYPLLVALSLAASTTFSQERFINCAAAFIDGQMLVNEYSPSGTCEITHAASGELTVQTADLSPDKSIPTGKIAFRVAIRDGNTKTLLSFSEKTYREIDIQKVLDKCQPGDAIVLLTTKAEYALPHSEILVRKLGE